MAKGKKERYRFDYEIAAWVSVADSKIRKPFETKEINEERILKSYVRIADKGGCLLDMIKNYMPWMSKDELLKKVSSMKKNCAKNGYKLLDIPLKPKKKPKKIIEKKIDYKKISSRSPKVLMKLGQSSSETPLDSDAVIENRKAYKAALDEHVRRLSHDEEYKKWHEGMTKEESRKAFQEEFMSQRDDAS